MSLYDIIILKSILCHVLSHPLKNPFIGMELTLTSSFLCSFQKFFYVHTHTHTHISLFLFFISSFHFLLSSHYILGIIYFLHSTSGGHFVYFYYHRILFNLFSKSRILFDVHSHCYFNLSTTIC